MNDSELRLIRFKPLRERLGVSEDWVRDAVRAGTFPTPIVLSSRSDGRPAAVAWRAAEIESWLEARRAKPADMPKPAETPKRRGRKAIA